jgi:hypothetical protein
MVSLKISVAAALLLQYERSSSETEKCSGAVRDGIPPRARPSPSPGSPPPSFALSDGTALPPVGFFESPPIRLYLFFLLLQLPL